MIRGTWERLDPKYKRISAVAAGAGLVLVVIWMFAGEAPEKKRSTGSQDTIRHVLTDRDTRDISIDGLAGQVKIANQQNDELRKELDKLKRELDGTKRSGESQSELRKELAEIRQQMDELSEAGFSKPSGGDGSQNPYYSNQAHGDWAPGDARDLKPVNQGRSVTNSDSSSSPVEDKNDSPYQGVASKDDLNPETVFAAPPVQNHYSGASQSGTGTTGSGAQGGAAGASEQGTSAQSSGMQILSHYQAEEEVGESDEERAKREEESSYIPAGSILTGVMLNGMDAPTSQGSRRDPFPSTIRIQHEAILPNRFRADVKECFLIVSGYGDLSSERAYLRGETISCVREDGGVIEARLDAYAVGEDGKAGVRGRLVSKQGAMIARSMLAGFMSGASEAFDVDAIPVIETGGNQGSQTSYQTNYSPKMFQGAAASGASSALDRIAQFYVDMAEGIFPVIEVDAGRQIELIMTSGTQLQIRSPGRG
jgi:conjugal transfer pilus assembly protein TraB